MQSKNFKNEYKIGEKAFTRKCHLTFKRVMMLILKKGCKSLFTLQSEFFKEIGVNSKLTAGALTKAKKKVSHKAFIELNKSILENIYQENNYQKWNDFRLLAVDMTEAILPNTQKIKDHFGTRKIVNQNKKVLGVYTTSKISVLYDVCNKITINAVMGGCNADEKNLFYQHQLKHLQSDDLLLGDRLYPGYRMLAELTKKKTNFVFRCSTQSFKKAIELHKSERKNPFSVICTLRPTKNKSQISELFLPLEIKVRFVYIPRDNNNHSIVLVTSLLDEEKFKNEIFLDLYYQRWAIETSNDNYKNKLYLENFTGTSVEAIKQDFFSVMFIANLESILILPAQKILDLKKTKQPQKVNNANAFHAIKQNILDLFYFRKKKFHKLFKKLTSIFIKDPISVQNKANMHEYKKPLSRVVNHLKYRRKTSF